MRVHFSFILTLFVALLFVSGTVGCRSNGGAWYNPTTYSFVNPFSNASPGNSAPLYASGGQNPMPSLDAIPNVDSPPGGYTGGTLANRNGTTGTVSSTPPEHWATQTSPNPYGGYTDPQPSQYSPYSSEPYNVQQGVSPSPYQYAPQGQNPQFSSVPSQYQNMMAYESTPPGQYQLTNGVNLNGNPQQPVQNTQYETLQSPYDPYAGNPYTGNPGNPQMIPQQQSPPPAGGYNYGETTPSPYGTPPSQPSYAEGGMSLATPPQSYQPQAGGGYNYGF